VQPLGAIAPRRPFIVQVKDQIPVRYIAIILWYRLTGALEGCLDEAFATGADGEATAPAISLSAGLGRRLRFSHYLTAIGLHSD